jgi:hypothetical protein
MPVYLRCCLTAVALAVLCGEQLLGCGAFALGQQPDPRSELASALKFYAELLEKKDVDKFLQVALTAETLKLYQKDDGDFREFKLLLNGADGAEEARRMRHALTLKPKLSAEIPRIEFARFEWIDAKQGRILVDLRKEDGKWFLNW